MSTFNPDASHGDSVSHLLEQLKDGSQEAAQKIWSRYVRRLISAAKKRLRKTSRRVADEDDVVSRAFASFLEGVQEGRFSDLNDRTDLWQVLVMLIDHKATDQIRALHAQKRGGGKTRGDSVFYLPDDASQAAGFAQIPDPHPTPEFVELFTDQFRWLMSQCSEDLKNIALLKLQNFSNKEIAEKLGVSISTVERKLAIIRDEWRRIEK